MGSIKLKSSDNVIFDMELAPMIRHSVLIKTMLEQLGTDDDEVIPLPSVKSDILLLVLKWIVQHSDDQMNGDEEVEEERRLELNNWDAHFLHVDQATLFGLLKAANYLDVKGLLDAVCKYIAIQIKGKTPEAIRQTFNIQRDMSAEEDEEIQRHIQQWDDIYGTPE